MTAPAPPRPALYPVAYLLAIWFGCGRIPRVPGTMGTLGAIPVYLALRAFGPPVVLAVAAVITLIGVWASGLIVRELRNHDPQIICIDEVAGVLITLAAAPPTWTGLVVGVVLFRLGDHLKPWPARAAERLPRGWGVMMDDVFAGIYAALLLIAARALGWL